MNRRSCSKKMVRRSLTTHTHHPDALEEMITIGVGVGVGSMVMIPSILNPSSDLPPSIPTLPPPPPPYLLPHLNRSSSTQPPPVLSLPTIFLPSTPPTSPLILPYSWTLTCSTSVERPYPSSTPNTLHPPLFQKKAPFPSPRVFLSHPIPPSVPFPSRSPFFFSLVLGFSLIRSFYPEKRSSSLACLPGGGVSFLFLVVYEINPIFLLLF